jgi:hypothetical protein
VAREPPIPSIHAGCRVQEFFHGKKSADGRSSRQSLGLLTHTKSVSQSTYPRPLTEKERDALSFLLKAEFPGVEELREQAKVVSVVDRCKCGCATIDFSVDTEAARPAKSYEPVPVEATTRETAPGGPLDLLLFVREGWLVGLEIAYYANDAPVEFPPPSAFEPPFTKPLSGQTP